MKPVWRHDSDFITKQYRARKQAAARGGNRLLTRAVLFQRGIVLCPNMVKRFRLYHEQSELQPDLRVSLSSAFERAPSVSLAVASVAPSII